jgi:hypothetical protein
MNLNVQAQAIAGAEGWAARFNVGQERRPLICWALAGDRLEGIVLNVANEAVSAESQQGFVGFESPMPQGPPTF